MKNHRDSKEVFMCPREGCQYTALKVSRRLRLPILPISCVIIKDILHMEACYCASGMCLVKPAKHS